MKLLGVEVITLTKGLTMYIVSQSDEPTFSIELAQELLNSSSEFPVSFDKAWVWLGYSRKDAAKESLVKNFIADFDFRIDLEPAITGFQANPKQNISLTVECIKRWGMMAGTEKGKQIRMYFLECEKKAKKNSEISDRMDAILRIAEEYETLKACTKKELPGFANIMTNLANQKALPPATRFFTAPEWLEHNAPNLTNRQRSNFFKDIAASHRLLVDEPPDKIDNRFLYNNKHEFFFLQKLEQILRHVPVESPEEISDFTKTKLTMPERLITNKRMSVSRLNAVLGYPSTMDRRLPSRVTSALKEAETSELLKVKRHGSCIKTTTVVIKFVKWWLNNKQ